MGETDSRGAERVGPAVETSRSKCVGWILLTGHRGVIALGITGLFAAFFTSLVLVGIVPLEQTQPLLSVYSALIVGNLTLITVIVSINQLFLSRELQAPGELQTRIEAIVEYREEVERTAGEIAPATPLRFLRILVEATRQEAQQVGGFAKDGVVTSGHEEIEDVVRTLTEQMDQIDSRLRESGPNTFEVLSVMLETNYAQQIYRLRTIQAEHADGTADVAHEAIDDLIDRLRDIDVSRQYFRSIYLQEELSALSRYLLYTGLPSEAVAIAALLVLSGPADQPDPVVELPVLVPVTLTIGLVPLAILCSFFLRTATVTKLTAATVPFTTPEGERL